MKRYEIETGGSKDIPVVGIVGEGGRVLSSLPRSPSELPHVYEEGIIPPDDEPYTAPAWVGVLSIWAMLLAIGGLILLARWLT
jgi:hypothetical protein